MVEHLVANERVAGSNLVSRSIFLRRPSRAPFVFFVRTPPIRVNNSPVPDYSRFLDATSQLLLEAGRLALADRAGHTRAIKPDGSIVTNIDCKVEAFLRPALRQLLPEAGIWGEEEGYEAPTEAGQWLIDPIDGTSNYSFGMPLWGTSIALAADGVIQVGGVFLPDTGDLLVSARGCGVLHNGNPLPPIPRGPVLPHELVGCTSAVTRVLPSNRIPGKKRDIGAFVVSGAYVAMQRLRGLIAVNERLYDVAPCLLFVQELEGDVRLANGQALDLVLQTGNVKFSHPWIMFPKESGFIAEP